LAANLKSELDSPQRDRIYRHLSIANSCLGVQQSSATFEQILPKLRWKLELVAKLRWYSRCWRKKEEGRSNKINGFSNSKRPNCTRRLLYSPSLFNEVRLGIGPRGLGLGHRASISLYLMGLKTAISWVALALIGPKNCG